jgi:hypothetical protein
VTRYAERTKVPVSQSRDELVRTLTRYGADQFMFGEDADHGIARFRVEGRYVQFAVEIPDDPQRQRQRWRALVLVVKAKLEAVESGISTFEREFLADLMLPDGSTVGDFVKPQIEEAYKTGLMPKGLLALGPGGDAAT